MTPEENKMVIINFMEEVFNKRNTDAIDDFVGARFTDHSLPPGFGTGRDAMKQMLGMYINAFPDLQVEPLTLMTEGNLIALRVRARGTHQGEFMGIPPTGKKVDFQEMHMARLRDGKIVEHWGIEDSMTMFTQLGLITPPGQG